MITCTRRTFIFCLPSLAMFLLVRDPLNSLMLGLTVLSDNEALRSSDTEALAVMDEAASFITSTLKDVMTMHNFEEG